jgi:hypothetical protein
MQPQRVLSSVLVALATGASWPWVMQFSGEAAGPLAAALGTLLHSAGLTDKAGFLLAHRLISGAFWVVALAVGFGLILALSARGSVFRSWLFFVGAALASSYLVEAFVSEDLRHLSPEWVLPEAWLTLAAAGLVAWLFSRGFVHSRAAP